MLDVTGCGRVISWQIEIYVQSSRQLVVVVCHVAFVTMSHWRHLTNQIKTRDRFSAPTLTLWFMTHAVAYHSASRS